MAQVHPFPKTRYALVWGQELLEYIYDDVHLCYLDAYKFADARGLDVYWYFGDNVAALSTAVAEEKAELYKASLSDFRRQPGGDGYERGVRFNPAREIELAFASCGRMKLKLRILRVVEDKPLVCPLVGPASDAAAQDAAH